LTIVRATGDVNGSSLKVHPCRSSR